MDVDMSSSSIVGLACCGIYYSKENMNSITQKLCEYIKKYKSDELECPIVNTNIEIKFLHNGVHYCIQVAPLSRNNDYAVISGNGYSVFKVKELTNNHFRLVWNGETYSVFLERNDDSFKLNINQNSIVYLDKVDDIPQSSLIKFPPQSSVPFDELNSLFDLCMSDLNNILAGFHFPEPILTSNIYSRLDSIFSILRDPLLPSLQFQIYLDDLKTLLPNSLISDLQQTIGQYTSNFSSLFSRFPSEKIKLLIDHYLEGRLGMSVAMRPMLELAELYSGGIRGHAACVIDKLLLDYFKVEIKFQDEETIMNSNLVNTEITVADLISHINLKDKNKLLVILFEFLEKFLPGIILDIKGTIQKLLTCLHGSQYNQIIPKLREVLVTGQIPSYEVRKNEMESIFLSSINGFSNDAHKSRLEKLICSNSEVFDIISDFFYHRIIEIRKCAMEVYIRRAYIVYEICSFEQSQLVNGQLCVLFKFSLPKNNRKSLFGNEMERSNSYSALINKTSTMRKFSPTYRRQISSGYMEREDISDGEISNEEYFQLDFCQQKSNDCDTDSAISVGACSLTELYVTNNEPLDTGSGQDIYTMKPRYSPSIHSLDTYWPPSSNYASLKETEENPSFEQANGYKQHRHSYAFCNNTSPVQDNNGQYDFGVMIIFETMEEIEKNLPTIRDLLSIRNSSMDDLDFLEYDMSTIDRDCSPVFKVILKIVLRDTQLTNKYDDDVAATFLAFCDKHLSFFEEICVCRITFLLQSTDKTIRYFTFRNKEHFEEDIILRNIDPILSFQIEINRLRNYHLERLPVPNRRMYVYLGTCKDSTMAITAECRLFARCIIHHKDFNVSTTNIDAMAKEAERNLLEAMDAFDMAWIDERTKGTKSNHIFFYFHSVLCINKIEELENVVRTIIFRHGKRLWSLRITQAELKMSVKLANGPPVSIRLWVHNEGGKCLDICIYREEFQLKTDHKVLVSWSFGKEGRYHGIPVDGFYSI